MRHLRRFFLAITVLSYASVGAGLSQEQEEATKLQGKIVNSEGRPVAGARIILHDDESRAVVNGRSDADGDFEISHEPCSTMSFDVFPPEKTGLATAHYAQVAGDITKHFIVQLHKGFRVTGRVLAEGQGLRGLEITATGNEGEGHSATIHGGGATRTRNNGEFTLILTPGKKIFQIKNELYSNLSPVYQHEFTITTDVHLPDMKLPLVPEKNEQKK